MGSHRHGRLRATCIRPITTRDCKRSDPMMPPEKTNSDRHQDSQITIPEDNTGSHDLSFCPPLLLHLSTPVQSHYPSLSLTSATYPHTLCRLPPASVTPDHNNTRRSGSITVVCFSHPNDELTIADRRRSPDQGKSSGVVLPLTRCR
ncbi:unnamed protein product [Protopolystoma xenopodis]|uniref:Uncharacterized protein n=1 Tax=Protopolystoma xenopodis TaxID=117903 RepID=A0A448XKA1_9PLAT|nr:unnamed protein product [Protopolystoma xenopodis]